MPLALYVVLGVGGALLLVSVVLLFVPVNLTFNLGVPGRVSPGPALQVRWLFGLVKRDFPQKGKPRAERGTEKRKKAGRRGPGLKRVLNALRTRGLPGRGLTLARRLLRQFRFRELDVHVRVGLGDPAETGMLCAAVWPALYPRSVGRFNVLVEPEFLEPCFELAARGRASVVPARLVWPLTLFILSPSTLIALRRLIRRRG